MTSDENWVVKMADLNLGDPRVEQRLDPGWEPFAAVVTNGVNRILVRKRLKAEDSQKEPT